MSELTLAEQLQARLLERRKEQLQQQAEPSKPLTDSKTETEQERHERIMNDESCWVPSRFGNSTSILPR